MTIKVKKNTEIVEVPAINNRIQMINFWTDQLSVLLNRTALWNKVRVSDNWDDD